MSYKRTVGELMFREIVEIATSGGYRLLEREDFALGDRAIAERKHSMLAEALSELDPPDAIETIRRAGLAVEIGQVYEITGKLLLVLYSDVEGEPGDPGFDWDGTPAVSKFTEEERKKYYEDYYPEPPTPFIAEV